MTRQATASTLPDLRGDRVARFAAIVYALVILPFVVPVLDAEQLLGFTSKYTHLLLILTTLVALLHGMGVHRERSHRWFWLAIATAYIAWLTVRLLYLAVPEDTEASLRAADALYLCYYASLLVAVSFRPHLAQASSNSAERWIEVLGTLLFAFGLLIYFVFIPAAEGRTQHLESVAPFLMFGVFNLLLLGSLVVLWRAADAGSSWRRIYGLLALSAGAWCMLDVVEATIQAWGIVALEPAGPWDLFWLLPYAFVIAAARLGVVAVHATEQATEVVPADTRRKEMWGTGRLLAFAATLPALHLALSAVGSQSVATSPARAACAATSLVILTTLAFLQQRYASQQRARVIRQLAGREEQLRRSQKLEAIGTLAAAIVHEFNNLLFAIGGSTELALQGVPQRSEAADDLRQARKSTARAAALSKRLLLLSRRQPQELRDVSLNELTANISQLLERLLGQGITSELRIAPVLDSVCADPSQIEQVVLNLAMNARDAMSEGGTLIIETSNLLVEDPDRPIDDLAPGRYVKIAVSDTGRGIDPRIRDRIFEPFFTTKPDDQGTGLGLSICHDIIQAHGGHIDVRSTPGRGTTVSVLLKSSGETLTGPRLSTR